MDNHPDIQHTFADRVTRANAFNDKLIEKGIILENVKNVLRVVIDPWGDIFENTYQAWPDQYYIISGGTIIKKATYSMDAIIDEDYVDYLLQELAH